MSIYETLNFLVIGMLYREAVRIAGSGAEPYLVRVAAWRVIDDLDDMRALRRALTPTPGDGR